MPTLPPLAHLDAGRFDTPAILKKLATSSRALAELKGIAASIPNQGILINTLVLQEAKDSSEIENIVHAIKAALFDYKHRIRAGYKFYSQDLINNLFTHPYTKIDFVQRDLKVSRLTATKYLDALAEGGFVRKMKVGRSNYYINLALDRILRGAGS
jgi:Fic family protein